MKLNRLKFDYNENASSLHKKIGEVLRSSKIFQHHKIYQEYPVELINPSYKFSNHKFDWVILDLAIVIEVHGQQHYKETSFGGVAKPDQLLDIQKRDTTKRDAAVEIGFTYLEISYEDIREVDDQFIYQLWQEHKNPMEVIQVPNIQKQKLSKWRKKQYRLNKQRLKGSA